MKVLAVTLSLIWIAGIQALPVPIRLVRNRGKFDKNNPYLYWTGSNSVLQLMRLPTENASNEKIDL